MGNFEPISYHSLMQGFWVTHGPTYSHTQCYLAKDFLWPFSIFFNIFGPSMGLGANFLFFSKPIGFIH